MSGRHITITGSDGKERTHKGGFYIPGAKAKKRMEDSQAKKGRASSPRAHAAGRGSATRSESAAGSLIGGIKSSEIRASSSISTLPFEQELSEEERQKIWQPPIRDNSRFDGSSSSRHRSRSGRSSSSIWKDDAPGGSFAATDEMPPDPKKRSKSKTGLSSRKERKPDSFTVLSVEGKLLYECSKPDKRAKVKSLITAKLPAGSYIVLDNGIRLTTSLTDLGFETPASFTYFCVGK